MKALMHTTLFLAASLLAGATAAQTAVPKQVKIVVPFTAGASNDAIARAIAPQLAARFGNTVIVSDPALTKQIFTTSPDILYNIQPNLSRLLGPGSVFALDGAEHRARRKLLTPPFHGKSIRANASVRGAVRERPGPVVQQNVDGGVRRAREAAGRRHQVEVSVVVQVG